MAGETEDRTGRAAPGPEIRHLTEGHRFAGKAKRFELGGKQLLAARVVRGDGLPADERVQQLEETRIAVSG